MTVVAWSESENLAVLALYFAMLVKAKAGDKYVKAQMIRDAQNHEQAAMDCDWTGELDTRSRGSIEMKLMNVTAALENMGRHDLSMGKRGYVPRQNMQKDLPRILVQYLIDHREEIGA